MSNGTITLHRKSKKDETYHIEKARLSFTNYHGSTLVNFWARTAYEVEMPDGTSTAAWGPTIEFLTTLEEEPKTGNSIAPKVLSKDEAGAGWDVTHSTGFYIQSHQTITNGQLILTRMNDTTFKINFTGEPSDDYKDLTFEGEAILEVQDSLERYW